MKVLMSAFACEPGRGSEPGIGWNWALQAARFHEVWVITRSIHQAAIELALSSDGLENVHFVYYDLPYGSKCSHTSRWIRFYYLTWQTAILPLVFTLNRDIGFDVIHHVTYNTIECPGLLWLIRAPFVWGPVGGAQIPPKSLRAYFGRRWGSERRRMARKYLIRVNLFIRLAVRRSAFILAANADTHHALERLGARNVRRELEAAIKCPDAVNHDWHPTEGQITILWAGGLIPIKAPLLALDVIAALQRRGVSVLLLIAGEGELRKNIELAIHDLGLENAVRLLGALPHSEMGRFYQKGSIYLFTSLRDTSGNVVLEAMAHALPIVALNHQGVAEMVSLQSGFLIPIHTPQQVVEDIATAIERLAGSPELRRTMGQAGRTRVEEVFNWERKGELLRDLYPQLLQDMP